MAMNDLFLLNGFVSVLKKEFGIWGCTKRAQSPRHLIQTRTQAVLGSMRKEVQNGFPNCNLQNTKDPRTPLGLTRIDPQALLEVSEMV